MKTLLELLRTGLMFLTVFLLGCMLVVLGIGAFLWLEKPQRLAVRYNPETQIGATIDPQPLQIPLAETNVMIIDPPASAYLSGAATNAAIWVNGKAFKSGEQAGWEFVKSARRLWLLGAGTLICSLLLKRYGSTLKTESESKINIPERADEL